MFFQGVLGYLEQSFEEATSDTYREWLTQYMSPAPCAVCQEKRLRPESLAVKVAGWSIADFTALPIVRSARMLRRKSRRKSRRASVKSPDARSMKSPSVSNFFSPSGWAISR